MALLASVVDKPLLTKAQNVVFCRLLICASQRHQRHPGSPGEDKLTVGLSPGKVIPNFLDAGIQYHPAVESGGIAERFVWEVGRQVEDIGRGED